MSIPYGQKIRALRAIRGLTQVELAAQAGVGRETLVRVEATHVANKTTRQKIEAAFGLSFDSPAVEMAFSVLATEAARPDLVRLALAILEHPNGHF
jgi:transcriptional regulator with XRE-family HTH domain